MAVSKTTQELRNMLDSMDIPWEPDISYYYGDLVTKWRYKNISWTAEDEGYGDGKLSLRCSYNGKVNVDDIHYAMTGE